MIGKSSGVVWVAASLLLIMPLPATSQDGSAAPQGSYLKTCNNIRLSGGTLTASCILNPKGDRERSSIHVPSCGTDIWNHGGTLTCYARRGTWGLGSAIPRGSYVDTCYSYSVRGTVLSAMCIRCGHQHRRTSLELKACRMGSNISNNDGQLICIQ